MSVSRTAQVTLNEPCDEIDLEAWLFELSDSDYQACAKGHQGAGVFADEQGRGMVNVESIGGNLIVQHYRLVRGGRSSVELDSRASRVYLFHLVPVAAGVRWTLEVTPTTATTSDFTCTVEVELPPVLGLMGRLSLLGPFLGRHVREEARGFAADIVRKRPARVLADAERVPLAVG
jgi:hypothetical protein